MTVTAISRKAGPFSGVGLTSFAFSFKCSDASELTITHTTSAGVETTLVKDVGYTVSLYSDQDSVPGGTITLSTALLSGEKLTVTSGIELTQPTAILNAGAFLPQVVEETFDRLEMQIQQQQVDIDRCVKVDVSGSVTADELRQALLDGSAANAMSAAASAVDAAASAANAAAAAKGAASVGRVIGIGTGGTTWVWYAPDGSVISQTGSTTCGLQEAINYAFTNHRDLVAYAGPEGSYINCTTQLHVRSFELQHIFLGSITLNFAPMAAPGIWFDSGMMLDWQHEGQVVYMGGAHAVYVNPTNAVQPDNVTQMVDSKIRIKTIAYVGTDGTARDGDESCLYLAGNCNRVFFDIGEINGANFSSVYASRGITIANNSAWNCRFDVQSIHHCPVAMQEGTSSGQNVGNVFNFGSTESTSTTLDNISIFGNSQEIHVTASGSLATAAQGVHFQSTSGKNMLFARLIAATLKVNDQGTNNHLYGDVA